LYPGIRLESYDREVDLQDKSLKPLQTYVAAFGCPKVNSRSDMQRRGKITMLSINRFERKKNIGLAIHAFAELRKTCPGKFDGLQLVIAGK
jgi:alpha-1,3/alpha-1,6-mannosyltransferase